MGKYRLKEKAGSHHHNDGRTYHPGEIITSRHDLAKLFKEKFDVVEGAEPAGDEPLAPAGRTISHFETDEAADNEAKVNNANLPRDEFDTDNEDADEDAGAGEPADAPQKPKTKATGKKTRTSR